LLVKVREFDVKLESRAVGQLPISNNAVYIYNQVPIQNLHSNLKKGLQLCLFLLGCIVSDCLWAQESPDFVQFFVNAASLNPSYVGIDGQPAVYFSFRKQWAGVPGSPTQGQVSFQTPLPSRVLLGFTAFNNTRGMLSTSAFLVTGGYQVKLGDDQALRFGMSLGGSMTLVNVDGVTRPDDPMLLNVSNTVYLQGNAGISYHRKTFHAGFSLPQFVQPYYTSLDGVARINPFETVVFHASNRFYFNRNKNVFEPYAIYRFNHTQPSQFELAAVVHLQNKVWVGGSYRQGLGVSAIGGIKLNRTMAFGYSFTSGLKSLNGMPRTSHELHLGLLLGKRDKNITGVYSFVNTEKEKKKKTPAQIAAEREALAKKYQKQNVQNEPAKPVVKPAEKTAAPKKDTVVVAQQPKRDSAAVRPAPERHEFVKAGNNRSELPKGNYVIVGAFRSEANAKRFSIDLHQMDIEEASYGFITSRGLWYVYLATSGDLAVTKVEWEKYRHEHMFKDAWILTVQ
jgi:type IX secretion system PorP/SprF family membrane protein